MKTILVLTDFSNVANNAADYALRLAKTMKANIRLCHAFKVAAEEPVAAHIVWPLENYNSVKSETDEELRFLAEQLAWKSDSSTKTADFKPLITCSAEIGSVSEVARNLVNDAKLSFVVMGTTGTGGFSHFMMGSNCREMIENASFPLLLVPAGYKLGTIRKIAFATDLMPGDIDMIHSLTGIARVFNAEILISHITSEKYATSEQQQKIDSFLNDVTCKVNYNQIYYRHIENRNIDSGLEWLTEHSQIDMLSMVHRQHNQFFTLLKKSHTQKLARQITLPLLIFPENYHGNI
jgi:nucleotide-binding universal stress UspA family protein